VARKSKTDQEIGYIRMFWEECRAIEADYFGAVSLGGDPQNRTGIIRFKLTFTPIGEGRAGVKGSHSVAVEFPGASIQTLAGTLWSASMKLHDLVALAWEEEARTR